TVAHTTTVTARAYLIGWGPSIPTAVTYTMNFGTLGAPTIGPAAGSYTTNVTVTLSAAVGSIRYTTDGSTPSDTSPLYTGPFLVSASGTVTARAFEPDYAPSASVSAAYTIVVADPVFTPTSGTYTAGQTITLTSETPGAELHYTLNGSDPTTNDPS